MSGFNSVDEIMKWYERGKGSVEDENRHITDQLKWQYTDVLYSFKGIYIIGAYVFDRDKFERTPDGMIKAKGKTSRETYNRKFVRENYEKFKELNNNENLKDFLKCYTSVGNVIPIWPGGNSHRGLSGCYDLPDIYFHKNERWLKCLNEVYSEVNLDCLSEDYKKDRVSDLIDDLEDVKKYEAYLKYIVDVIKYREKCIGAR